MPFSFEKQYQNLYVYSLFLSMFLSLSRASLSPILSIHPSFSLSVYSSPYLSRPLSSSHMYLCVTLRVAYSLSNFMQMGRSSEPLIYSYNLPTIATRSMYVCLFETHLLRNAWIDLNNFFFVSSVLVRRRF